MGYAVVLGLVGVVASLVFLGVTELGEEWYGASATGWFDGHVWWIGVAAGAGLIVGVLRHVLHMPKKIPGLIKDLEEQHIATRWVPSIVAVSAVSLVGGASLGPEVALGQMGGGAAELLARRGGLDEDDTKSLTLTGMAGAFGGLFSSPVMTMVLLLEIARPVGRQFRRAFTASWLLPVSRLASTSQSLEPCSSGSIRFRNTRSRTGTYSLESVLAYSQLSLWSSCLRLATCSIASSIVSHCPPSQSRYSVG